MRGKFVAAAVAAAALGAGGFATAASGEPTPTPSPSVTPTASPAPTGDATPAPAPTAPQAPGETTPAPQAPPKEEPEELCPEVPADVSELSQKELAELLETWKKNKCETEGPKKKAAKGGFKGLTYTEDVTLTADTLYQNGLSYDGVVDLPTRSGSVKVLKFSMKDAKLTGLVQKMEQSTVSMDQLAFKDDVTMYTTRMSGRILGIKLTLTPETPPPLVLPVMLFTDVEVRHTVVTAGTATATGLRQR